MKSLTKILKILLCSYFWFYLISHFAGCYSILPLEEIDNGNPNDPYTWKLYQLRWKAGTNPQLEKALNKYYKDCNPDCVDEYILSINLLDESDFETIRNEKTYKNKQHKTLKAKSIFLSEVDTCGTNSCVGTAIPWNFLDGDTRQLINHANAVKIRIPVNSNETSDSRTWKYFKILARTNDDELFLLLQKELLIEPPLENYSVVINILDPNPSNQFVVLGDESDPSALRYAWSQLSKKIQNGLINWSGKNKENLNTFSLWW